MADSISKRRERLRRAALPLIIICAWAALPPNAEPQGNSIPALNEAIHSGVVALRGESTSSYLRSVLTYLHIPTESQILVFSPDSVQAKLVNQQNPRAIYFNDDVAIAWVRGSSSIEAAGFDPDRGMSFYKLEESAEMPSFRRDDSCLTCHQSQRTSGLPGLFVLSTRPDSDADGFVSDHRTPLGQRWGGWYVTGLSSRFRHLGNRTGQGWLQSLYDQFETSGYLTEYSDIVALMTFEHQTQATNLITRLAREAKTEESGPRIGDAVNALVDYLLFVDEARLPSRIIGTSGFREKFETLGPFDHRGRSLRHFDLHTRMMRYPCSYMIYSEAFRALPLAARQSVYARMRDILSECVDEPKYAGISHQDREAVLEILRDTKSDLPQKF